jgi:hypothetical protein
LAHPSDNESECIDKLKLRDTVLHLVIEVVEELHQVLDCDAHLESLDAPEEVVSLNVALAHAIKDVEHVFKGQLGSILNFVDFDAALGYEWVDKALIKEGYIDASSGHEVNKVSIGALKDALVGLAHILQNLVSLFF